jgi:regulator of protease activity HflC (stomatin/prohibitin superfamily)
VWTAIQELECQNFIAENHGKFLLTDQGFEFLTKRGIRPKKPVQDPSEKKFQKRFSPPLFGTWGDMILWLIPPLITFLMLTYIFGMFVATSGSTYVRLSIAALALIICVLLLVMYGKQSYRSVIENERLVVFRLGRCVGAKGPGPVLILPVIDDPKVVDLREKPKDVPHETCITQDNVQIDVDFVFYWKIEDPVLSITKITNPEESITLLATALLRAVIAHFPFNDVLNQRESINDLLRDKIDEISSKWGVYVSTMEIREIKPPAEIVKSMHKQVSAEWQRKATVIEAEGEAQALGMLNEAAKGMDEKTKSLKYYEVLERLGEGQSTKYILPLELINLVKALQKNGNETNKTLDKALIVNDPNGTENKKEFDASNG